LYPLRKAVFAVLVDVLPAMAVDGIDPFDASPVQDQTTHRSFAAG
jgi:hypothetical protein